MAIFVMTLFTVFFIGMLISLYALSTEGKNWDRVCGIGLNLMGITWAIVAAMCLINMWIKALS